jgi:ketosteroid isomerase-like protein
MRTGAMTWRPSPVTTAALFAVASMPTPASAQDTEPGAIVDAFHTALSVGDSALALSLLSPDVVIFESGGAEMSRAEYRSHHLGADIEFAMAMVREISDRRVVEREGVAVVLTRSTARGTFRERELDVAGVETMVLSPTDDGWKISHIHWSSRRTP